MNIQQFGIIGDIHCEASFLEKAITFLQDQDVETILCTGDIADGVGDGTGDFDKCVALLRQNNVQAVLGNHDNWLLSDSMRSLPKATALEEVESSSLEYLRTLPKTLDFQSPLGEVLLCHGLGENDMAKFTPDDYGYAIEANFDLQKIVSEKKYSLIISGHSHQRMVRKLSDCLFINSGSLLKAYSPCFLHADFRKKIITFYLFNETGEIAHAEQVAFSI